MRSEIFALLVLLAFVFISTTRSADPLATLETEIKTKGGLTQAMFSSSPTAWTYLLETLQAGTTTKIGSFIKLLHITTSLKTKGSSEELFVTAEATLWDVNNVTLNLILFLDSSDHPQIYGDFQLSLATLPKNLTTNTLKTWYPEITLRGKNSIVFASETFTDFNGVTHVKGLTITGEFEATKSLPYIEKLKAVTKATTIDGKVIFQFPLTANDPIAEITLEITTPLHFGFKSLVSKDLTLFISAGNPVKVDLSSDLAITLSHSKQTLEFQVASDLTVGTSLAFTGKLQTPWKDVFGFPWLSFEPGLSIEFTLPGDKLTLTGNALVAFSKDPTKAIHVEWDVNFANELEFILLLSTQITSLTELFEYTIVVNPPDTTDLAVTDITLALSTFAAPTKGYQEGLTIAGDTQILQGKLSKFLQRLNATYTPKLNFPFSLYIPLFSSSPLDIDFKVSETLPIHVNNEITLLNAAFEFQITPTPVITFVANFEYSLKHNPSNPLTFQVSVDVNDGDVTMTGQLTKPWVDPLGFKWLTVKSLEAQLEFSTSGFEKLELSGEVSVTWGSMNDEKVDFVLLPDGNFAVTLSVTVDDMNQMMKDVINKQGTKELSDGMQWLLSVTIATTAYSSYQPGLTLNGYIVIDASSSLGKALKAIDPTGSLLDTFTADLYLPIFATVPTDVKFDLTETGPIKVSSAVTFTDFAIHIMIGPQPSFAFSTDAQVAIKKHSEIIDVGLSASWNEQDLSLAGHVQGTWSDAFGMKWMTINNIAISLDFSLGSSPGLATISLSFDVDLTFSHSSDQLQGSLSASADGDFSISIDAITVISAADAIKKIGYSEPAGLSDTNELTNELDLTLSSTTGLSLSEKCTVSGKILKDLKIFDIAPNATFELILDLPVYSTGDVKIILHLPGLRINKNMILTGVDFSLDSEAEISIATGVKVNFTHNPELEFDVDGSIKVDGSLELGGDMLGTWDNMFGWKGWDIANVDIAIGFDPADCVVDGCISALGLGYTLTVGTEEVKMYGYIDSEWHIFIEAEVDGKGGLALSFRDVAKEWNRIIGPKSPIHIDINDIPSTWGLTDMEFYLAPIAGYFNKIYFPQGFILAGGFIVFGIDVEINVTVTDDDFDFGFHIDNENFQSALNHELLTTGNPETVVKVKGVTLSNLKTSQIPSKKFPEFELKYEIPVVGDNTFKCNTEELADLYGSFHDFFVKYLKHLF